MGLKDKLVYICVLFQVARCTDLRLMPSSYPCCNAPDLGGGSTPNTPTYDTFQLDSETDPFTSGQKTYGQIMPPPFTAEDETSAGYRTKAYSCSLLPCLFDDTSAVCACNFNTGNVVTFKNSCDVKKHNCRFDTAFTVILNEICPWEFESRRSNNDFEVDYSNPKYYNK